MADTFSMFQKSETPAPAGPDMSLVEGVSLEVKEGKEENVKQNVNKTKKI